MVRRRNLSVVESDSDDDAPEIREETPPRSRSKRGRGSGNVLPVVRPQGLMGLAVERPGIPPVGLDPRQIHKPGRLPAMMREEKMMTLISLLPMHPLSRG
jgi:hypothetical protein